MKIWLILDTHYLCHRAFHSSRELQFQGKATGVVFGFLQSILVLKQEFQTDNIAFCFESRHLRRKDICPTYKQRRFTKERSPEEAKAYHELAVQISELRQRHLPQIGFKNIFQFDGMESDDIMAAIAADAKEDELMVLVTSDNDLLQCLRENVIVYSPQLKTRWTVRRFEREYGIPPRKWALVKAIAGCHGDEVKGIRGVGEKTALKFVRGELPTSSAAYRAIRSDAGRQIVRVNRDLVQLPYLGCPVPKLQKDAVSQKEWLDVCGGLGFRKLAGRAPSLNVKGLIHGQ